MLDLASIAADLAEVIDDLPVSAEFRGQVFTATSTDAGGSRAVEIDGELLTVDRSIVCAAGDMPADARPDERITVDGVAYRIQTLSRHQDGAAVEIALKELSR